MFPTFLRLHPKYDGLVYGRLLHSGMSIAISRAETFDSTVVVWFEFWGLSHAKTQSRREHSLAPLRLCVRRSIDIAMVEGIYAPVNDVVKVCYATAAAGRSGDAALEPRRST